VQASRSDNRLDQTGRGCLSIGTRHTDNIEPSAGKTRDRVTDFCVRNSRVGHDVLGHLLRRQESLGHNTCRALADRLPDKGMPILPIA
jgi:hypothetical protein